MKKFLKRLVYILGIIMIVLILLTIIGLVYLGKMSNSNKVKCSDCILDISIGNGLKEKAIETNFFLKALGESPTVSFKEALQLIERAKSDDQIKAISINGTSYLDLTQTIDLTEAIKTFKVSGKDVFAYGDFYTQPGFMLATQADSSFIHPMGNLSLTGFRVILSFYKEALDNWDVNMEVYKAGKFKGYAESFTQSEPSPENEQQYRELIDGLHASLIRFLVKEKGKSEAYWENVIANNLGALAQSAIDEQLIHAISYEKDFQEKIKSKYNYKSSNFLTLNQYKNRSTIKSKRANVAYVVMEGGINVDGDEISSNNLKKEFKKINESDDYKAVILRVNSGGGSAFASDDIWNEVEKIKNKGIPVIASVGNVAASGGYYVLMNSDKIFANENSVLGSIGVFMLFPNLEETMETHVGVNHVKFSTSDYSPNPDIFVELSPEMRAKYQRETEFIYETFVEKVSEGRGIDIQKVKEIAEGRIYTGARAKEIGLIDDFKSLNEIKEYLKDTYDLSYISLDEYPKETNNDLPSLLSSIKVNISGGNSIDQLTSKHLKEANNIIENSLKLEPRMELLGISIK